MVHALAEHAHRGDPGAEVAPDVAARLQGEVARGGRLAGVDEGLSGLAQMGVSIDESRQHGMLAELDHFSVRGNGDGAGRACGGDAIAVHEHHAVLDELAVGPVEQVPARQSNPRRASPMGVRPAVTPRPRPRPRDRGKYRRMKTPEIATTGFRAACRSTSIGYVIAAARRGDPGSSMRSSRTPSTACGRTGCRRRVVFRS